MGRESLCYVGRRQCSGGKVFRETREPLSITRTPLSDVTNLVTGDAGAAAGLSDRADLAAGQGVGGRQRCLANSE